jgi:acyl-CoA thioesterase
MNQSIDALYALDACAKWLGIEPLDDQGVVRLKMRVHQYMLNGVSVCHGGILFTLADTALAYALFSEGFTGFGIEGSIHFLLPAYLDDTLLTRSTLERHGKTLGIADVVITNQHEQTIALFRGSALRKKS